MAASFRVGSSLLLMTRGRLAGYSAICTALVSAPFRKLSLAFPHPDPPPPVGGGNGRGQSGRLQHGLGLIPGTAGATPGFMGR